MAAKKMTASKKSSTKKPTAKRPPRQVWLTTDEGGSGEPDDGIYLTKKAAQESADRYTSDGYLSRVIGPYVLAERAAER